jgi:hypothetical protein
MKTNNNFKNKDKDSKDSPKKRPNSPTPPETVEEAI